MKILHVINTTHMGGTEMMLLKLISTLDRTRYEPVVATLVAVGPVGESLRRLGVPVHCFGMRRGIPDPRVIWRLMRLVRQERPDLIQTWLHHSDLLGGLAGRLAGKVPVVWNLRNSDLQAGMNKRMTSLTASLCARLSDWLPTRIICGSEASRVVHSAMGYAAERLVTIPNGFDIEAFQPDSAAGPSLRQELGIPASAPLIGLVARFDPQKGHDTFLAAADQLHRERPDVHFILCGDDITWENQALAVPIEQNGLRGHCHLLGRRSDMPRIQAAMNIASLTSTSEGFPNVLGEAMASGVPCVATDVGDAALIVGETGRIVPPRDPEALSLAWGELIGLAPEAQATLGAAARARVVEHFRLTAVAARYADLYDAVAFGPGPSRRGEPPLDAGSPAAAEPGKNSL